MFKHTILIAALLFCTMAVGPASPASGNVWQLSYGSSVEVQGASGFVISQDASHIFIATAAHVIRDKNTKRPYNQIWARFYWNGGRSQLCYPTVVYYIYDSDFKTKFDDFAIIKVPKTWFARNRARVPRPLNLLSSKSSVIRGTSFVTFGSPGQWLTGYSGKVVNTWSNRFTIQPSPKPGRSGSAVVDFKGNVLGIILQKNGTCLSASRMRWLLSQVNKR